MSHIKYLQEKDSPLARMRQYLDNKMLPGDEKLAQQILLSAEVYYLDPDTDLLYHINRQATRPRDPYRLQLVVPKSLHREILIWAHDDITGGHLGTSKTFEKILQRYFWDGMYADVRHWCKSCISCSTRKSPKHPHKAPLIPIPVEGPFDRLAVDCLGPFPLSLLGNRYAVVFSDYLTKWPEAFAVPDVKAPTIARLLINEVMFRHSSPRTLLSDRGTNFLSFLV